MRFKVEKFNGQGRFFDEEIVDAYDALAARELAFPGIRGFYDAVPGEAYVHVTPWPEIDNSAPCPRCGSDRWLCGGPSDSHE